MLGPSAVTSQRTDFQGQHGAQGPTGGPSHWEAVTLTAEQNTLQQSTLSSVEGSAPSFLCDLG